MKSEVALHDDCFVCKTLIELNWIWISFEFLKYELQTDNTHPLKEYIDEMRNQKWHCTVNVFVRNTYNIRLEP